MPPVDFRDTPERPASHSLGSSGQTAAKFLFEDWGWTADLISSDYGEDLDCTVFLERRRTALHFRCQVKAIGVGARGKVRRLKAGGYSVEIASRTATAWALSYFPILLSVYDKAQGRCSWIDGSRSAREKLGSLVGQTVTFRVPDNDLAAEQPQLLSQLQEHYARLFRLDSAELVCNLYPLLMPGHRAVSFAERLEVDAKQADALGLCVDITTMDVDAAPAWATAINTLDGSYLRGWRISSNNSNVELFADQIRQLLETVLRNPGEGWHAFVRDPVCLSPPKGSKLQLAFGAGDLTEWSCYSDVGGVIADDAAHAFQVPDDFLSCIARHGRSWNGDWSVAKSHDLAVQLFATTPTTPGYRARMAAHRRHAEGQFLEWECEEDSLDALDELLASLHLTFDLIEGIPVRDGKVTGVIVTPMFNPAIGLIPQARNWDEFDRGSVRARLEQSGIYRKLPGRQGTSEVRGSIIKMLEPNFGEAPYELLTAESLSTPGIPLDHSKRLICVERFRIDPKLDVRRLIAAVEKIKADPPDWFRELSKVELACDPFDGNFFPIVELSICWAPQVDISTVDLLQKYVPAIASLFDSLIPRVLESSFPIADTLGVLKTEGALYFEGDDPWGLMRRAASSGKEAD